MSAGDQAPDRAPDQAGSMVTAAGAALTSDRARLVVYLICLAVSFALYLIVHGQGQGLVFWLLAAATVAGLSYGGFVNDFTRQGRLLRAAVILALGLALVFPLGTLLAGNGSFAAVIAASPVWPQILVALFASRV